MHHCSRWFGMRAFLVSAFIPVDVQAIETIVCFDFIPDKRSLSFVHKGFIGFQVHFYGVEKMEI